MAVDLASKSMAELKTILQNHERAGKTGAPSYGAATAEMGRRNTGGLSLDRTIEIIREAAQAGHYLSYQQVAEGNGAVFVKVRTAMTKHLLDVSTQAHRHGWPMLSAIVVNKPNVATGAMEATTLKGFCACAAGLGLDVSDPPAFLQSQQAAVFKAAMEDRLR